MILWVVLAGGAGIFLIWRFYAVIYELMQQKKLFKTRKNYTDLLIFISSALNEGQTEEEISTKLTTVGWNKEQVKYAISKATIARRKLKRQSQASS